MEYRKLKHRPHRCPRRFFTLRDLEPLFDLLDERAAAETEMLEEMASLREAVNGLEFALFRVCEGIEEVAALLHDALNPTLFPEPLRDGPPPLQQELSWNGLVDFPPGKEDDVPF